MPPKIRADQLAFEQGLAESREAAKRLIMAGAIYLETPGVSGRAPRHERVDKPGRQLPPHAVLQLATPPRYVSRGGEKLETALHHFQLDVTGLVCMDAGASTGGFTDCLLQHGAARVFAVDVGASQLHEKLLADPRVTAIDGVNLRHAPPDLLPTGLDLVTADLSFISITVALPAILPFLKPGGLCVTLIKPQFELGPGRTVKGVVRDETARQEAVDKVLAWATALGLDNRGVVPSKIKGPKGNQEYLTVLEIP